MDGVVLRPLDDPDGRPVGHSGIKVKHLVPSDVGPPEALAGDRDPVAVGRQGNSFAGVTAVDRQSLEGEGALRGNAVDLDGYEDRRRGSGGRTATVEPSAEMVTRSPRPSQGVPAMKERGSHAVPVGIEEEEASAVLTGRRRVDGRNLRPVSQRQRAELRRGDGVPSLDEMPTAPPNSTRSAGFDGGSPIKLCPTRRYPSAGMRVLRINERWGKGKAETRREERRKEG